MKIKAARERKYSVILKDDSVLWNDFRTNWLYGTYKDDFMTAMGG